MHTTYAHSGEYAFTVWGKGVSCLLEHDGRSVYWQGDEAAEITDRVDEEGTSVLPHIWSEYEHIAEED
jgi:hypothetical protein